MLLKKLCNASGVSGGEDEIRRIIKSEIESYTDEITTDYLGNLIAYKKGRCSDKKVMLCAHMDEVGFIVCEITDKGYLKFKTVGGIDTRVILGKPVVFSNKTKGIIGIKAVHLLSKSELDTVPKIKDLYIDIGAKDKEEAEKYIELGDYATFDTEFEYLGGERFKAKAIDDRVGVSVLIEALKEECLYDLYACFTVQEEVGLRGSGVCSERIKPDVCLVLESTTCSDVQNTPPEHEVTALGEGVALSFMDSRTITDIHHLEALIKMADDNNIKYQLKKTTMGGNDAGSIHLSSGGVVCASASVPCRYLHGPVCVADMRDVEAMQEFLKVYISRIGEIMKWNC